MKIKSLTLLFATFAIVETLFAWDYENVKLNNLYYNLDASTKTAEVTYSGTDYDNLKTVTLPESVEYNSVTYIVTSIGDCAFQTCFDLKSVTIPNSVTSIGEDAFWDCHALPEIILPNSITSIGARAFYRCKALTSVNIPNGITEIEERVFESCKNLTSIEIPNNVTSIGWAAFRAAGLTSVEIPNSVTEIGSDAFSCANVTSLIIGSGVTYIGDGAFKSCEALESITCKAIVPPTKGGSIFSSEIKSNSIPLYVPAESIEAYKAEPEWKMFMVFPISESPTAVFGTEASTQSEDFVKFLHNGQLLIHREGKTYNVQGAEVK